MVTRVKLKGLNIRKSRGKWFVSFRRTGVSLVRGFVGTRAELGLKLAEPEVLRAYTLNAPRALPVVFADGTLGALIDWFRTSPGWGTLAPASIADYEKTFAYLRPEYDTLISGITSADVYKERDAAAKEKWPRFADKMVSHLSKMFKEGIKRGKADHNPASGLGKLHKADPEANHEWRAAEYAAAIQRAPQHLLAPLIIARHQGFRGQTCQALMWSNYVADPRCGRAFALRLRKNDEPSWFPAEPETRAHLDGITRTSTFICTREDGTPWEDEKQMQSALSHYLGTLKAAGLIRKRCTVHGLRVTYAAAIRRMGLDTGVVADALGDRSKQMGEHYTRHVEKEVSRMRAFRQKNGVQSA